MSDQTQPSAGVSEEFFLKVNDIIEAANRIERRLDTHHAEMVLLHAFSRYSAHHFLSTAPRDEELARKSFANYIAGNVEQMILSHLQDLGGPAKNGEAPADAAAEPKAE